MKDEGSRPRLRSYLADSGVPPEKFLEAFGILGEEIKALLESAGSAAAPPSAPPSAPAPAPAPQPDASENDNIRRILEGLKARWVQQDRARGRAEAPPATAAATPPAPETPPAAPGDAGRITLETVVLKGPAGGRAPLRPSGPPGDVVAAPRPAEEPPPAAPPPPEEQPTTFIRVDAGSAPAPPPSPRGGGQAEQPLLETVVKRPGATPPGVRPSRGTEPPPPPGPEDDQPTTFIRTGQPAPTPEPTEKTPEEDDLAKTVILRPDQARPKGKGGPR